MAGPLPQPGDTAARCARRGRLAGYPPVRAALATLGLLAGLAACAVPGSVGTTGGAAQTAGEAGVPAAQQIVGVVPTGTPEPVQQRNTGGGGPPSVVLPLEGAPLRPDVPALPPPFPTATLAPGPAAAATRNAATAIAGATSIAGTATALPAQNIVIQDFAFSPSTLTIRPGQTVIWRNLDISMHQITGGDFDSGRLYKGQYWAVKHEKPGVFSYFCTIHPSMQAQITVTQPSGAQTFSS